MVAMQSSVIMFIELVNNQSDKTSFSKGEEISNPSRALEMTTYNFVICITC
jgi:hypothetical protein